MARVLLIRRTFCFLIILFFHVFPNIFCFLFMLVQCSRNFRVAAVENLLILHLISFLKSEDCIKNQQLCSLVSERRGEMREMIVNIAEEEEKILSTDMESLQPKKKKKKKKEADLRKSLQGNFWGNSMQEQRSMTRKKEE